MGMVLESFAQFMPAIFFLHVVGIIWEMVVDAFRGRWS